MIMIKFPRMNMKNINRFVLIALLCAPIVYLFGSLFTAINGDKQSFPLSASYEIPITSRQVDFNQRINSDNNFTKNTHNVYLNCTEGFYNISSEGVVGNIFDLADHMFSVVSGHTYVISVNSIGDEMSDSTWQVYSGGVVDNLYRIETTRVFTPSSSGSQRLRIAAYNGASFQATFTMQVFDITQMYGDSATLAMLQADYDIVAYNHYTLSRLDSFTEYGVPDNSQYLFNQFFAKDNFLSQMGKEALSDSDKGFYPANALLRVLDENVLHYGPENNTACMAYGYFVWVFNVVLLDMVVYLSMKLLLLPLKAVDVFERGNDL